MEAQIDMLQNDRVRRHTGCAVQAKIDATTRQNIAVYAGQSRDAIDRRIAELDREADVEQVLEVNASLIALTGTVLGVTMNKRFFLIPAVVLGFLTEHAISGWCPPVPVFRRLGIRTRTEIDQEKFALKALRGDFSAARARERSVSPEDAYEAASA